MDDNTVEIVTFQPYAALPNDLAAILILNREHVTSVGEEQVDLSSPVGTGPYQLAEWVKEDRLVLEANEDYWAGAPGDRPRRLPPDHQPGERAHSAALLTGELDIVQDISVRRRGARAPAKTGSRVITLRPESFLNLVSNARRARSRPPIHHRSTTNPMQDKRVPEADRPAIDVRHDLPRSS